MSQIAEKTFFFYQEAEFVKRNPLIEQLIREFLDLYSENDLSCLQTLIVKDENTENEIIRIENVQKLIKDCGIYVYSPYEEEPINFADTEFYPGDIDMDDDNWETLIDNLSDKLTTIIEKKMK